MFVQRFIDSFETEDMTTEDFFYFFYDQSQSIYSDSQFIGTCFNSAILSKTFEIQEDSNQFVTQEELKSVIK